MTVVVIRTGGNFHDAACFLNEHKLGEYLKQMELVGNYTLSILVVNNSIAEWLKKRGLD